MSIFSKELSFSVQASESKFIHWFRENVDRPKLLDMDIKKAMTFYGELSDDYFWMKKKRGILYKSRIPFFTLDFTDISGFIESRNGKILINLKTRLNSFLKTILLVGLFLTTFYAISSIREDNNFKLFYLLCGCLILLFLLWRIRLDAKFLQNFLTSELEK